MRSRSELLVPTLVVLLACAAIGWNVAYAQAEGEPPVFKPEEIEALVAPIALYPDSLLSQVLMAATYPLEVVQAARWVKANPNVKGDAAVKAVESQPWDVSVKSLVAFPQILEPMDQKLDWTQKLGDAFLADQKAVLDAVQRLRSRADKSGNLQSTEQQKVIVEESGATANRDQDRAGESGSYLRAGLQPDRRLRQLGLSVVSAVLLAAVSSLVSRRLPRPRFRLGRGLGGCGRDLRRLQLGARRRQHQRQQGHQHRPELRPHQGERWRPMAA